MPPPTVKPLQNIPFGRSSWHFVYVQNTLALVLQELKQELKRSGAVDKQILWVTCRLNTSQTGTPVFAGWVEDSDAITIRVNNGIFCAPIDIRFGDTHVSDLYLECLKLAGKTVRHSKQPASSGSQEIGKNFYGETNRMSVPIKIADRSVGTLNAAFIGSPVAPDPVRRDSKIDKSADTDIEKIMVRWAQDDKSDLVTYVEKNLNYCAAP
jgi:hypothetical protein